MNVQNHSRTAGHHITVSHTFESLKNFMSCRHFFRIISFHEYLQIKSSFKVPLVVFGLITDDLQFLRNINM